MGVRLTDEQRADRQMSEAKLNDRIMYRARKYGVHVCRMQRALVGGAWRTPATKGFPDLQIFGLGGAIFRELKKELGKLDPDQERWRDIIIWAGGDWGVWRPSDLRNGRIERELISLTSGLTTEYIVHQEADREPCEGEQNKEDQ